MTRTGATLLVLALTASVSHQAAAEVVAVIEPDVCTYRSEIIGRRCTPYGRWGLALEGPYVFANVGARLRNIPARSPSRDSTVAVAARAVTAPVSPAEASSSTLTGFQRFGLGLAYGAYVALEAELGPGLSRDEPPGHRSLALGGLGLVGMRVGTRVIALGAELGAGGRLVDTETRYGISDRSGEPVLEVRAHGDLWLTPWCSVGAEIGSSLITFDDWVTGLYVGFHTHSYGGRR